ncbi:hypothetical protein V8E54_007672 [Elaphomyces granulatus]
MPPKEPLGERVPLPAEMIVHLESHFEYTPWAKWFKACAVEGRPRDDPEVMALKRAACAWGPYPVRKIQLQKRPITHSQRIEELRKFREDRWLKRFAIDIDAAIDWHAQFPPKALCSRKIVNFQDGKKVDKLDNSKPVWSEGSKRLRSSKTRKSLSDTSTSQESKESNESEKNMASCHAQSSCYHRLYKRYVVSDGRRI